MAILKTLLTMRRPRYAPAFLIMAAGVTMLYTYAVTHDLLSLDVGLGLIILSLIVGISETPDK